MLRSFARVVNGTRTRAALAAVLILGVGIFRPATSRAQLDGDPVVPATPDGSASSAPPASVDSSAAPIPNVAAPSVVLLPITHAGVDAVVPRRVGETLTRVLAELGYGVADPVAVMRAYSMLRPTDPPSPADVFRMTIFSSAARGLHVRIAVEGNSYVADLLIASADGTGPFRAHVVGGPREFLARCDQALRAAMPPPSAFDAAAAARYAAEARAAPPVVPANAFAPSVLGPGRVGVRGVGPIVPRGPRFGITFVTESAFGTHGGSRFYNHILGARLDFHLGRNIVFGAFAGYVNLDRGSQRGSNVLGFVQLEDRLQFGAIRRVQFPLRFGFGYLPLNGPVVRLSGGLRVKISDTFELGIDLLAPTFWWIPGDRRVTYDIGLELTRRFGASD